MAIKNPNRQVIMMGNHTLVITLPMDWVKQNGIRPGMMIQLEELMESSMDWKPAKCVGLILTAIYPENDRSIMGHGDRADRGITRNPVRDGKA